MLCVTKYPFSRFWAVYEDGQLLCVTVYKKGALAVMRRLQQARRTSAAIAEPTPARFGEGMEEHPDRIVAHYIAPGLISEIPER